MYNTTQKKWIADNPIPFMTGKTDDTVTGGIDAFDKNPSMQFYLISRNR